MAFYITSGSTTAGTTFTLAGDHLQVTANAVVASTQGSAVVSSVAGNTVTIQGTIAAAGTGIDFNAPTGGAGHRIAIYASAMVQGVSTAISLKGTGSEVTNWGIIDSGGTGIALNGTGIGLQKVTNFGIINGGTSISISGTTEVRIDNVGTIASSITALKGNNGARISVYNSGDIFGDIRFGSGNDLYDGSRGGTITGAVFGGTGNDRFKAGMEAETFDGGNGFDTVVFTGTAPVWAALDGYDLQSGAAVDDVYISIEGLTGATGNDILSGSSVANDLNGRAGNDHLMGLEADDTLTGGRGSDTLDGGAGADAFVFQDLRDAGDVLVNFSGTGGEGDTIRISIAGFKLSLAAGVLGAQHFGSSYDPNPDAVVYNGGGALYIDPDGAGTAFGKIRIAEGLGDFVASDVVLY